MPILPILVVNSEVIIGVEHKSGWFKKTCPHCLAKTKERVRHKFPASNDSSEVGYWTSEPQHFACHLTYCIYSLCKHWSQELLNRTPEPKIRVNIKGKKV